MRKTNLLTHTHTHTNKQTNTENVQQDFRKKRKYLWSKRSFGVDVANLPTTATALALEHTGDGKGVTELRLSSAKLAEDLRD